MTEPHDPDACPAPVRVLVPAQAWLGEGPLWCDLVQGLYWCNIEAGELWRWQAADGQVQHWSLPGTLGSLALTATPGVLLVALTDSVALFDTARGQLGPRQPVPVPAGARLNDGRCDPQGRFIVGPYHYDEASRSPWYRIGPGLQVEVLSALPAPIVANSLAFSPDGRQLYFSDTPSGMIWRADYAQDAAGQAIGTPTAFAQLSPDEGWPDGATVDALGQLWVALWGGGAVQGFGPDGTRLDRLQMRSAHPTCPTFGGPGLATLFVTSARKALEAHERSAQPHAGDVYALPAAVPGLPAYRYRP